jgi:hypothetical protein
MAVVAADLDTLLPQWRTAPLRTTTPSRAPKDSVRSGIDALRSMVGRSLDWARYRLP